MTLHGFELLRDEMIPELNTRAQLYRHVQTGAELLSLQNDDENKAFGITFTTLPEDSTGIAHIMEHSVLCGSRKYPVKEPFIELVKGSLQTFVNAFTFPDKTMYPLASQNLQDFYNLIDVYLDAVFYPNLTPQTLEQEGWHYEVETDGTLSYKGVVFNEMKGAYADPDNLLNRLAQESLFPDNTYGVDSGGDPAVIPQLSYEQFRRFHDTYYHPTNARIFFWGDDPPEERLRVVDDYLKDFEPLPAKAQVALQPRLTAPRRFEHHYPAGKDQAERAIVTVNWMLDEAADAESALALAILDHILVGVPASPLRKALLDSGLGEDLAGGGLETDLRQWAFSTGLKGIKGEDAQQVEDLVLATLRELVTNGIEPGMVEAAVNTVEFERRELNTGTFPRGLAVGWQAVQRWVYGGDPLASLHLDAPLAALKAGVRAGRYFETLIQRALLDNPHRTTVLLAPDPELGEQQRAEEAARLAAARAAMTDAELSEVRATMEALQARQDTPDAPEALATIPRLGLDDLPRTNKAIPLEVTDLGGVRVLYHDLFTNGILYLDLGFNLHAVPAALVPYLGLFGRVLLEMGTAAENYVQLSQRIGRTTGGIEPRTFTSAVMGTHEATVWGFLRGKATPDHADDLLAILRDVLLTPRLDNPERFRQIVLEEKASLEAQLMPQGHLVVRDRLNAALGTWGWASEQMGGVAYLFFLRALAERLERDWPGVRADLEEIWRGLVNRNVLIANVTLDAARWQAFAPRLAEFLAALPAEPFALHTWDELLPRADEGLVIPSQVNYVGKAADLYALGYTYHGALAPLANLLRTGYLWDRIRVRGGAYGAFAMFDRRSGVFTFLSYRDPNLIGTLGVYDHAADYVRGLDLDRDEVVKAIIGAIGALDAYQLPDAKGYTSLLRFLTGETEEERQQMRDEILGATLDDFRAFGDVLARANDAGRVVVLGSGEAIERANEARPGWLRVRSVL